MDNQIISNLRQMILTGYRHHSYELERKLIDLFFRGEYDITLHFKKLSVDNASNLGPQPLRALMNSTICLITVFCRSAIEYGADNEHSFTLSDYYINKVEEMKSFDQLMELNINIVKTFRKLAQKNTNTGYSLVISQAIRFINQNLYTNCRVSEVASHVKRSPNYLAALFKKEVGMSPIAYIIKKRMDEARKLLADGYSVSETADILGYCDVAHFSNEFKRIFGHRPSK